MNSFNIKVVTVAISLAFSAGAMAASMTKAEYKTGQDNIAVDYNKEKAACDSLAANAKDVCVAEAKGQESVAKAQLESAYRPSSKATYEVQVAKAEAIYAVANQKCDAAAGNTKDVCVKEAKAAETKAKADAKAQMKTSDAKATANDKSAAANNKALKQTTEARKEAAADKIDADYTVAREKCDTFAGGARDTCLDQAKASFGKI